MVEATSNSIGVQVVAAVKQVVSNLTTRLAKVVHTNMITESKASMADRPSKATRTGRKHRRMMASTTTFTGISVMIGKTSREVVGQLMIDGVTSTRLPLLNSARKRARKLTATSTVTLWVVGMGVPTCPICV